MSGILLTQNNTFIIGPVSKALGWIMNGIYIFLDTLFNIQNIGLCIILFTFIVYMLMTPLTMKQQKFSKMSSKMNPEIQKVQKKYKGKKDQDSMLKMNEETKAIYEKYGVSPTGSCLQLIIQMPILFALYRVIWNIPAYVGAVKDAFLPLVDKILTTPGTQEFMETVGVANQISPDKFDYTKVNTVVDVLYKFKPENWTELGNQFPGMSDLVRSTNEQITHMNNFGVNIADAPLNILRMAITAGSIGLIIGAVLIPLLAGLTQWINTKLMTQTQPTTGEQGGSMQNSMKMMNNIMPIFSAVFCLTLPAGLGLYWIAGAVIRSVQQFLINRHLDKVDLDELLKKNLEKANKKREKMGLPPKKITTQAKTNVKSIEEPKKKEISEEEKEKNIKSSTEYYKNTAKAKPGSLASKANMVRQFNEKNKK